MEPDLQDIKHQGKYQNLPDGKVFLYKFNIPGDETAFVIIRVILGMYIAVMLMMFGVQFVKGKCSI